MPLVDVLTQSMQDETDRMDVLANNLSNSSSAGFKRLLTVNDGTRTFTTPSLTPGVVQETGRPLDVAIEGSGFLVAQTDAGEQLVRVGQMQVNTSGQLATMQGQPLLGESGPLQVPSGVSVAIAADGTVTAGKQTLGKLRLEEPAPGAALQPIGENRYVTVPPNRTQAASGQLHSGAIEMSNVSVLSEMTHYIESMHFIQFSQKGLQTADAVAQKLTDDVGRSQ